MKNKGFVSEIFILLLGIFSLIMIIPIFVDFFRTIKYSVGWVWVERNGSAVKEFIKEENGCIYFIDVWDREVKTCGIYQIEKNK